MQFFKLRAALVVLLVSSVLSTALVYASEEGNDLRAADSELNAAYHEAVAAMPNDGTKTKLREAQRAWVAFRDAEMELKVAVPGATGNLLKMWQTDMTEMRTKQLKELSQEAAASTKDE